MDHRADEPGDPDGPNHRGYPTIQLWKLPGGGFRRSVIIDLSVWVDAAAAAR